GPDDHATPREARAPRVDRTWDEEERRSLVGGPIEQERVADGERRELGEGERGGARREREGEGDLPRALARRRDAIGLEGASAQQVEPVRHAVVREIDAEVIPYLLTQRGPDGGSLGEHGTEPELLARGHPHDLRRREVGRSGLELVERGRGG